MQLEIDYEPGDEEVVMTLDGAHVLKATLGARNTLVVNTAFKELEDENFELYTALRKVTLLLLDLQNI